jgi:hypothetical protein
MDNSTYPSPKILYPEWQGEYLAALLEFDPKLLRERLLRKAPATKVGLICWLLSHQLRFWVAIIVGISGSEPAQT